MMFTKGSHQAPLCSLVTISNPKNVTETGRNASLFDDISMTSELTFQVATTDLQGVINIWVVVEVSMRLARILSHVGCDDETNK